MSRTDTHKPSLLDPSEYRFQAAFYQGSSDAMERAYREDHKEYQVAIDNYSTFQGNHAIKATCDHCGAAFAHGVLFLHIPTQALIHVGHICASNTVGLPSKAAAAKKRAEANAREENERIKRHEERAAWQAENADVVAFLAAYSVEVKDGNRRSHPFLDDMARGLHKWGSLFPKQADAVRKFIANDNKPKVERPVEAEPTTPLIEGRREVTGVILSAKFKDTDFGSTPKMLVKEADGNKVWSTIPNAAFDDEANADEQNPTGIHSIEEFRGRTITFTAKIERSRDDEHFGFGSRPTSPKVDWKAEVA